MPTRPRHRWLLACALLAACGPSSTPTPVNPGPGPEPTGEPAEPVPAEPAPDPASQTPDAPATTGYQGLGAESVDPAVIAKFAAAPLDSKVSSRIQAMLDVRGVGGGYLATKKNRLVYNWSVTGTTQVWRQDGPMKYPVQLTGGEDRTSVSGMSPDESFIIVSRDVGGAENPGLYLQDIDGGPLVEIHRKDKVQTFPAFISDDSKSVWYMANDRDPASYAIYRWSVADKKAEAIFTEPGIWRVMDHEGEKRLLLAKLLGNTMVEIYELDVASKKLTPVIGQGEGLDYGAEFGAKPGTYIVQSNKQGDFHRLYELADGKLTPITAEMKHDVESFGLDLARKRIYYSVNRDGYSELNVLDARTYKPLKLPRLPKADHVVLSGVSRDGRYAQVTVDGATMPATTVVFDWKTRKATTWRVPSTPEVDVSRFASAKLETYPARDGTPIPMFVWRPDPSRCQGPCPVVVEFHGGPEGQSTPGFSPGAQLFVDAGFVLVQPNVRGSTGYGKTWLDADNGARRLEVITDIEDVALHIKKEWAVGGVAPKVGITGGSYGGYATLMGMTYFAGTYDAGVSEVGISNLITFLENTAPYRRILRMTEYGDPEKDRAAMEKLSPTTHIDKLKAPLLIIQGVNDPRVPVGEALQFHEQMQARKVDGGLILFADEGHGTAKRSNRVLSIGHTIAFFQKHLQ